MPTIKCPGCREKIEHLNYTCQIFESGLITGRFCPFNEEHYDEETEWNDSETDDYDYSCPECDYCFGFEEALNLAKEKEEEAEEDKDTNYNLEYLKQCGK